MSVMTATNASLAAFVKTIKRMSEEGMLVVASGVEDRRVRNYDLAPQVRAKIAALLTQYLGNPAA
jgi:DNA-binding MarR family transcriptional regulator